MYSSQSNSLYPCGNCAGWPPAARARPVRGPCTPNEVARTLQAKQNNINITLPFVFKAGICNNAALLIGMAVPVTS